MSDSLENFLRKKAANAPKAAETERTKRRWIAALSDLYDSIENWIQPLIKDKIITLSRNKVTVIEEYLGSYMLDSLKLVVGPEAVSINPVGTYIVGAHGRVDLVGEQSSAMLLLSKSYQWEILLRDRKIGRMPLSKETFFETLKAIMRK